MSVARQWQEEIQTIFDVVGESFDFWTTDLCACHVHVSPGPTTSYKYSLTELNQMAKGAFYWEEALCELIPPERRKNRYADPNCFRYAKSEYFAVPTNSWAPVFGAIDYVTNLGES